jgi:ABC-type Mn2+/Zn2+ transport system permease subunit
MKRAFSISAFVIVTIGILAQGGHFYMIATFLSNFDGVAKVVQSLFLSVFFTFGLFYFTLKSGYHYKNYNGGNYQRTTLLFAVFEGVVNLYYWTYKLVLFRAVDDTTMAIDWSRVDWYSYPIAVLFSVAIPFLIYSYSGEIDLKIFENETTPKRNN